MPALRFVFPVIAEGSASVRLTIESSVATNVIDVMPGHATRVVGAIGDLSAVERSASDGSIRSRGHLLVAEQARVAVPGDAVAFASRFAFDGETHRATLAALVAGRYAAKVDESAADESAAVLWANAKAGIPIGEGARTRLVAELRHAVEMVDVDRFHAFDQIRALGVVEAALLEGAPRDLVLAALGASADVYWRNPALIEALEKSRLREPVMAEMRWLSVVGDALTQLDVVDPIAVDVLACALHRIRPPARPRAKEPAPPPAPAPKPAPERVAARSLSVAEPPQRKPTPAPLRTASTTIGGSTLTLTEIETPPGKRPRFRVEIDGVPRRVRVRQTFGEGFEATISPPPCVIDWIEDDDGELEDLYACLSSQGTKRSEEDGRLLLSFHREWHFRKHDWYDVSIVNGATGSIEIDLRWCYQDESHY